MAYPVGRTGSNGEVGADFRGGYYGEQVEPSGGGFDPNGPLAALESDPYKLSALQYPRNVGTDPRGHYINFYVNVADNSTYLKSGKYTLAGGSGTTATNQANDAAAATEGAQTLNEVQSLFTVRKTKRISGAISLYMPETVNVQYNADWQSQSLTDAAGSLGQYGSIAAATTTWMNDKKNKSASGISGAWAEVAGKLAEGTGYVGQGATDFAIFAAGYALNPQLQVLFKGTDMRQFQFDFLFAPFNEAESKSVLSIIRQFKFHQAPEVVVDSVGRFFVPPSEFDIDFQYNGQTNKNIHKIGTCVLTSMNVDYAPNGWSTFQDGSPTNIRMTLNFTETEIVTKQRVDGGY